jgi:hypothetical protein
MPGAAPPRPARNGIGAVTFAVVLLGAVLSVFPATAAFGLLICLLAIVPASIAYALARTGRATNRRRSVAALVLAPVFLLVAAGVVGATTPAPAAPYAADPAMVGDSVALPEPPPVSSPVVVTTVPEPATPVASPVPTASSRVPGGAGTSATGTGAPQQVVAAAPTRTSSRVSAPAAPRKAAAASSAVTTTPKRTSTSSPGGSSSCESSTHYVNDDGDCVHRPTEPGTGPSGASARCKDGQLSYSKSRRGTCSRHGGVAEWLAGAPAS